MATTINTFRTVTVDLTTTPTTLYTTPNATTAIVLMAQCTNVTNFDANVTFSHYDGSSVTTELTNNFTVPVGDAVNLLTGKLVIEANKSITGSASDDNALKLTLSILETK